MLTFYLELLWICLIVQIALSQALKAVIYEEDSSRPLKVYTPSKFSTVSNLISHLLWRLEISRDEISGKGFGRSLSTCGTYTDCSTCNAADDWLWDGSTCNTDSSHVKTIQEVCKEKMIYSKVKEGDRKF